MTQHHAMGSPLARSGDARLYADRGAKGVAFRRNVFWGVCDGRRDQKFSGLYKEVVPRFERWAVERHEEAEEAEEEKEETVAKETEGAAKAQERPDRLWSLVFRRGSTSRVMMAFADESRAYDMADINTKALEVAGADGEWTVDELEVRW